MMRAGIQSEAARFCSTAPIPESQHQYEQVQRHQGADQRREEIGGVDPSQSGTALFQYAARICDNTGWTSSSTANAAGNTSATGRNSSGFIELPAGCYSDSYNGYGNYAYVWSATSPTVAQEWAAAAMVRTTAFQCVV